VRVVCPEQNPETPGATAVPSEASFPSHWAGVRGPDAVDASSTSPVPPPSPSALHPLQQGPRHRAGPAACPAAARSTFPSVVSSPNRLPCDSGLASCSRTHRWLEEPLSLSSSSKFGGGILFLSPGQACGKSHGGMAEENQSSQQDGVIQHQATSGPSGGLLSHRPAPSTAMVLQPRAFACLSHPEHANKDWFELFGFVCSWLNSNDVRIKSAQHPRQHPRGDGVHAATCNG